MAKGNGKKPDFLKPGETPKTSNVVTSDDLSPVDKGIDFIKPGETAQISNRT